MRRGRKAYERVTATATHVYIVTQHFYYLSREKNVVASFCVILEGAYGQPILVVDDTLVLEAVMLSNPHV